MAAVKVVVRLTLDQAQEIKKLAIRQQEQCQAWLISKATSIDEREDAKKELQIVQEIISLF